MLPGAQGLYVMPGSPVRGLKDLQGKTVGVNAPGNILYLLVATALAERRDSGAGGEVPVHRIAADFAGAETGQVAAAALPEPFASQAEEHSG